MITYRPTWAEIDLKAVRYNYGQIKRLTAPGTKIMVVVKANAYGHGIIPVSQTLEKLGVDYLGVATMDEAVHLRKSRIKSPILVLGSVLPHEIEPALKYGITLTLCSHDLAKPLHQAAAKKRKKAKVHIKVDTGMGRIGVWHEEAVPFVLTLKNYPGIELEGIYTHFSVAGRDNFFTKYQLDAFRGIVKQLKAMGIDFAFAHSANSIGSVAIKQAHLNLVRPGLVIYGMYPKRGFEKMLKLKPVMALKTKIVFLKDTPAGRSVSYGRTYITQKDTKIATLPIGYADGYERILSNKAQVLVRGKRAPVVGKVTMDQTMIDVGHIPGVKVGDEVVLIGCQGLEKITAEEIARLSGTIPYEIVCSIGSRVPRVYLK